MNEIKEEVEKTAFISIFINSKYREKITNLYNCEIEAKQKINEEDISKEFYKLSSWSRIWFDHSIFAWNDKKICFIGCGLDYRPIPLSFISDTICFDSENNIKYRKTNYNEKCEYINGDINFDYKKIDWEEKTLFVLERIVPYLDISSFINIIKHIKSLNNKNKIIFDLYEKRNYNENINKYWKILPEYIKDIEYNYSIKHLNMEYLSMFFNDPIAKDVHFCEIN
jgi:hypothetical protein